MIGRHRPVEQDAVRVLTVVDQLGRGAERPFTWDDARTSDRSDSDRFVDTESQLQHLDHLVRHPIDLAYVLMDQVRSGLDHSVEAETDVDARFGELARRTRRLLGTTSSRKQTPGRHRPSLLRPFETGSWQRWDDVLAVLSCRGLLRVETLPGEQAGELRYRLTSAGARWLQESVYSRLNDHKTGLQGSNARQEQGSVTWRERCELLRDVLPTRLLSPRSGNALGHYLDDLARRLDSYREDEQIRPEDDLLGSLFQSTFAEQL